MHAWILQQRPLAKKNETIQNLYLTTKYRYITVKLTLVCTLALPACLKPSSDFKDAFQTVCKPTKKKGTPRSRNKTKKVYILPE